MPDEKKDETIIRRLKVRCKSCGREGNLDFGEWSFRITGAVEAVCPGCGKKTIYVGQFGYGIDSERQLADLQRPGFSPEKTA